jgi:hypothetical protein
MKLTYIEALALAAYTMHRQRGYVAGQMSTLGSTANYMVKYVTEFRAQFRSDSQAYLVIAKEFLVAWGEENDANLTLTPEDFSDVAAAIHHGAKARLVKSKSK